MIRFHVVNAWLDQAESDASTLTIEITVTNGSSSESLDFRGWALDEGTKIDNAVVLADDEGGRLSPSSTSGQAVSTRSAARRLNPKESATEQLVFEAPAGESGDLRLALPYAAIGRTGYIGFLVPRVMIMDRPPGAEADAGEARSGDVVTKPDATDQPPESDDPFSMDVLRNSIQDSMEDGVGTELKPESAPLPSGTTAPSDTIEGVPLTIDGDDQTKEPLVEE